MLNINSFTNVGRSLSDPSTGIKKYWCLINKILNKAKIPEMPPLLENDIFVVDFSSKAQIFNDYFILQCRTLDTGSEIPSDILVTASQVPVQYCANVVETGSKGRGTGTKLI